MHKKEGDLAGHLPFTNKAQSSMVDNDPAHHLAESVTQDDGVNSACDLAEFDRYDGGSRHPCFVVVDP